MSLATTKHPRNDRKNRFGSCRGFSLIELMIVTIVLAIVLGAVVNYISIAVQRSAGEQTKVDLTQDARSFVDEFERDLHQSGYPGCRMFNTGGNCSAFFNNHTFASGLVLVSNTEIVFEGDVDGDGNVESVQYRLIDSTSNYPPTGTCPCTIQRSQVTKVDGAPLSQAAVFSQELQNVVNSGVPAAGQIYGGGLQIAGNVRFGGGALTNTQYYAAVTTFKDYPVFSAYDQNGSTVTLPADITTALGQQTLATIKSVRLTINLLASGTSGYDQKTGVTPVVTLVADSRLNN